MGEVQLDQLECNKNDGMLHFYFQLLSIVKALLKHALDKFINQKSIPDPDCQFYTMPFLAHLPVSSNFEVKLHQYHEL